MTGIETRGRGTIASSREMAVAAARAAADKRAEEIVVLDVSKIIVITDCFVICTAETQRQIRAVVEGIEDALRDLGMRPARREGEQEGGWWLLDFVDVVVHVFGREERDYYDLERLWRDAPHVPWEPSASGAASQVR